MISGCSLITLLSFRLTVRDSSGDGVGEIAYTLSIGDEVLVENAFETGGTNSNEFSFDPSQYTTEPPTASPTPDSDSPPSTSSPNLSPTQDPNTDRNSASPDKILGFTGLGGLALSALISLLLQN